PAKVVSRSFTILSRSGPFTSEIRHSKHQFKFCKFDNIKRIQPSQIRKIQTLDFGGTKEK
ncbi:710_t:CDS:2, partial [Acaulospora morrowiae]